MKLFKKTAMSLALGVAVTSGALMMGVSAPVQAVNIAQDGLGQVLVFPYYTTRDGWSTLFNLTNTSNKTVLIKVRWREGKNSRDVRDFNIGLSPYDTWTAVTRSTEDGKNAKMLTTDDSCTLPALTDNGDGSAGVKFSDFAYTKHGVEDNRDKGVEDQNSPLDRAREGYFEVFNMGTIDNADVLRKVRAFGGIAKVPSDTVENKRLRHQYNIVSNVKHAKMGGNKALPKDCRAARRAMALTAETKDALDGPENVLKGRAILVKGPDGIAAGYDPLVLANFAEIEKYREPQSASPNLNRADPIAIIIDDADPENVTKITVPTINTGHEAVSALISRSAVINDYNVTGDSETDWILTFPTKNFYVDRGFHSSNSFAPIAFGAVAPVEPFGRSVNGEAFSSRSDGKSCFDVNVSMWDREEFDAPVDEIEDQFSPREPGSAANQNRLCYETNVLSFGDSNLFSSQLQKSLFKGNEAGLPGLSGWAKVTFGKKGARLPVIGMRVEIRNRGDASVNYGLSNNHAYKR